MVITEDYEGLLGLLQKRNRFVIGKNPESKPTWNSSNIEEGPFIERERKLYM